MHNLVVYILFVLLISLSDVPNGPKFSLGSMVDSSMLNVGEELWKETLPLRMGSRLYQLQGLKPSTWYEVKISYPASIPASFSLQLMKDSELALYRNRKLLNTEKLIFKTENINSSEDEEKIYVLVNVEPEGVVAIPNVQEREFILFNIVCDELLLGIPHKAWGAVVLVLICLILAFIVPSFLPSWLLLQAHQSLGPETVSKHF